MYAYSHPTKVVLYVLKFEYKIMCISLNVFQFVAKFLRKLSSFIVIKCYGGNEKTAGHRDTQLTSMLWDR
jgi:hypothetical protein